MPVGFWAVRVVEVVALDEAYVKLIATDSCDLIAA
jgi:hypothetical protein